MHSYAVQRRRVATIPTGTLLSDASSSSDRQRDRRIVGSFHLDRRPVTNADFLVFVLDTKYVTVAERDLGPGGAGSYVFRHALGAPPAGKWEWWWRWTPGASWRNPEGPNSSIHGRELHPVVHIALEDALNFASWAGKRLPTATEWEYACREGRFTRGRDGGGAGEAARRGANVWAGRFPAERISPFGAPRTTAAGRSRPNRWGLADMVGNVWEWTATAWPGDRTGGEERPLCCSIVCPAAKLAAGAKRTGAPAIQGPEHVIKGGSHLCSGHYCDGLDPANGQPQAAGATTGHLGFRCAAD